VSSDVIIYDYLVDPDVLQFAPRRVELIAVGKVGRTRCTPQAAINQLLIGNARAGKRVVRLKGGDPFLFGRGGEEAEALESAGIPFEIVPGVSSALAVPAYAGIPVTHRGYSSSVAVVTGSHAHDGAYNSKALTQVAHADTIVILMGVKNLREIVDGLLTAGKPGDTAVAVIRWGTYQTQQVVIGTLRSIAHDVESAGVRSPAVIVVGEVVHLREKVNWFEKLSVGSQPVSAVA
jgi:uroporphyrin-III C-methyltransferase